MPKSERRFYDEPTHSGHWWALHPDGPQTICLVWFDRGRLNIYLPSESGAKSRTDLHPGYKFTPVLDDPPFFQQEE